MKLGSVRINCSGAFQRYVQPSRASFRWLHKYLVPAEHMLTYAAMTPGCFSPKVYYHKDRRFAVLYQQRPASRFHVSIVPRSHIAGPEELGVQDLPLLHEILQLAREISANIVREEPSAGATTFRVGFHMASLFEQLQVHLFSTDLSGRTASTRDFNKFATRYLLDLEEAIEVLQSGSKLELHPLLAMNYLAQIPSCPFCSYTVKETAIIRKHMHHCNLGPRTGSFLRVGARGPALLARVPSRLLERFEKTNVLPLREYIEDNPIAKRSDSALRNW
ncbi:hypothetical protein NDN08_006348 [Rhodosorus marinus]|uniref:Aprataxin C2HE/C2H2/C2HC zinc finger domain-containing protein n=1 Tax=Rhodosorus marinus TaxID=101924 RepID=A0AAV8UKJ7_9RHOD|nr:hypothetical protein NDN08_006348 [Rhodosorus marinus]